MGDLEKNLFFPEQQKQRMVLDAEDLDKEIKDDLEMGGIPSREPASNESSRIHFDKMTRFQSKCSSIFVSYSRAYCL